jgi:hypothetical protein
MTSLTRTRLGAGQGERAIGLRPHFLGVADDSVDLGHACKTLRLDLRRTSRDDEARAGVLAPELADGLARLADGLRSYGAGIDDDGVIEAGRGSLGAHDFGFEGIEPAAQRDNAHRGRMSSALWRFP